MDSPRKMLAVLLAVVLALALIPLAGAAEETESPDVSGLLDMVRLGMRPTPGERLEFMAVLLDSLTQDAATPGHQISYQKREQAMERVGLLMSLVDSEIQSGLDLDQDLTDALSAVTEATERAQARLSELSSTLPDQAQRGLATALAAMQVGRQRALDVLDMMDSSEAPGRPDAAQDILEQLQPPRGVRADEPEEDPEDLGDGPPGDIPGGRPTDPGKPEAPGRSGG